MGPGDFFKRKSLLPAGQRARLRRSSQPPKRGSSLPPDEVPFLELHPNEARTSGQEVFERTTVVPALTAEEHAATLMRALDAQGETHENDFQSKPLPSPTEARVRERRSDPEFEFQSDDMIGAVHRKVAAAAPRRDVALSFATLELDLEDGVSALGFVDRQQEGHGPTQREEARKPERTRASADESMDRVSSLGSSRIGLSDLYALGDFSGALAEAEVRLQQDPTDQEAVAYRMRCQEVLTKMWTARLGSLERAVRMLIPEEEIRWLSVDHRAGFVLSLVDGSATFDEILDMSGMQRLEALRILAELLDRGVIGVVR